MGKIAKTYSDLNNVAFSGSYNDLTDQPDIPSTPDGIGALPEDGTAVDSVKWNGYSVQFLTESEYQELVSSGKTDSNTFYFRPKVQQSVESNEEINNGDIEDGDV